MTNQEIISTGQTIKNETRIGGNTAERVGGVIEGIGENLTELGENLTELSGELYGVPDDYMEGVTLKSNGTFYHFAGIALSPFIPVSQGDSITFHHGFASDPVGYMFVCGYNSSKTFISGQYWTLSSYPQERTITISNANVAYVRFPFNLNGVGYASIGSVKIWEYIQRKAGVKNYGLSALGYDEIIYNTGVYDGWQFGYVHNSDGAEKSSSVNSRTGYIDVSGADQIRLIMSVTTSASNAAVCFYDSSLAFISSVTSNQGASKGYEIRLLDVPRSAKYIRASLYTDYLSNWFLDYIKKGQNTLSQSSFVKKQKITLEFGNLDASGQMKPYATDFLDNARTSLYYKLSSVNLPYSYTIYKYNSSYTLVETTSADANINYTLDIDYWYKIVINYTANALAKKEITIELNVIDKSYNIITAKTIKTFQYAMRYKKGRGLYTDGNSTYSEGGGFAENLISNTLRMYLPSNYSPTGEPVKLIYKAHGSNGYSWIDLDTWGGDTSIDYLADEGYALYDMYAGTSYYSDIINPNLIHTYEYRMACYNTPIQLAAQVAAYEWVVRNFNVDPKIYVFGKSHGGMAGIYATNRIVPTRAVALFAPLITPIGDRYAPWGNLPQECRVCLDDICFDVPSGMTFDEMVTAVNTRAAGWKNIILDNATKQAGLNAYLNGITNVKQETLLSALLNDDYKTVGGMDNLIRHSDVPVKVWCAPDDDQVVYANGLNFVKSLQNGGSNAQFRTFPSNAGGHNFDSFSTNYASIKDSVTTTLGVTYTAARAYVELVNFFSQF